MGAGADNEGKPRRASADTASYLADLAHEMSVIARQDGLDIVAFLFDMARTEAEETARRGDISGPAQAN